MKSLASCRGALCAVVLSSTAAWASPTLPPLHDPRASPESVVRGLQNDDALLERVANAIASDPELGDVDITVLVGEGRVALQGRTRTAGQAVRAVAITRRAAGSGVEVSSELTAERARDAAGA